MRRHEREIRDFSEILSIIERSPVLRLGMVDDGEPYVVPLNFGYTSEDGLLTLYIHSATEGRKIDILKKSPRICFELDTSFNLIRHEFPCRWSAEYESVIGTGTVTFLTDSAEKKAALDHIMHRYGFEGHPLYNEQALERACLYKITVSQLTGKRNLL